PRHTLEMQQFGGKSRFRPLERRAPQRIKTSIPADRGFLGPLLSVLFVCYTNKIIGGSQCMAKTGDNGTSRGASARKGSRGTPRSAAPRHSVRATRTAGQKMRSSLLDVASTLFKTHG